MSPLTIALLCVVYLLIGYLGGAIVSGTEPKSDRGLWFAMGLLWGPLACVAVVVGAVYAIGFLPHKLWFVIEGISRKKLNTTTEVDS